MPIYVNGAMVGMHDAVRDEEYQQKVDVKAGEILGDKESISLADLKKNSVFAQAYKELNAKGKARIDQIANMEGDAQNVSERELKVILTAMDANLQDWEWGKEKTQKFYMDGEASTGETGGLNQATDEELQDILQNTKTRAERIKEAQKKEEAKNEKVKATVEEARDIKPYDDNDRVNGGEWAKAFQIIHKNISWGNSEGLETWEKAFEDILGKGQVVDTSTYRDGGTKEFTLKDGSTVRLDNNLSGNEIGYVTVKHPDGTSEKFKPDGTKVEQ